ncbi:ATP-binding protein [Cupriavidus sp. P-10]|uniref:AAA family ATPase n=1 Tax=Cupriavidus sp. P-10 TaxID=2027911 RepID=UPI000E2EB003|nr:AAA family ATPase [Cupriavidus sp. P-10]BDB27796.1 ATP-binding protein [Cupriavidus sp. P-10]
MANNSLTMDQVHRLSDKDKIAYLDHVVLRHPRFERAARSLAAWLHPKNGMSTILLGGPPGVGKTSLVKHLQEESGGGTDMAFVAWPRAPHVLSVRHVVDQLAHAAGVVDGPGRTRRTRLAEQQRCIPRILVIDDVVGLPCSGAQQIALETLLAWNDGVGRKVLFVGNSNLDNVFAELASVWHRAAYVRLGAYGTPRREPVSPDAPSGGGSANAAYRNLLNGLRNHWPYVNRPDFSAKVDAFYSRTHGNMALTKQLYMALARKQASNGGKWDDGFLGD